MPYWYHYPERWKIDIRQSDGEGGYLTADYYVSEDVYNSIHVGDEFIYDENRDYNEEPYTRKEIK